MVSPVVNPQRSPPGAPIIATARLRERKQLSTFNNKKRCLCPVLCFACCLFLVPLIFSIFLQELEIEQHNQHLQQQQSLPFWEALEPVSLSQLRPPRLTAEDPQQQTAKNKPPTPPDGYFNGFPVYLQRYDPTTTTNNNNNEENDPQAPPPPHSNIHCVGENYEEDSWRYRSCHFSMLCYDLQEKDFVIFKSHHEEVLERFLRARPGMGVSSSMIPPNQQKQQQQQQQQEATYPNNETIGVALGGLNQKWQLKLDDPPSSKTFKWFPRVLNATSTSEIMTYYALPSNTVMVPYHSLSAKNPGHLVWDDFLPIYTLLTMFQLQNRILLPLRVTLPQRLWSSCEMSFDNELMCQKMTQKFAPLLVGNRYPYNITTAKDAVFQVGTAAASSSKQQRQSNYVCSPRGAAGLGALTDHGTKKLHGWMRNDYKITQNHGRGPLLYEFRNFMLENLGILSTSSSSSQQQQKQRGLVANKSPPYRIVFSLSSSDIKTRNLDFAKQIMTVQQNFSPDLVQVEAHVMKELTVQQQVQLASETTIFITICGGGAVTGMFLPKGASVILYYLEHGGVEYGVMTGSHAHLDWDLFNHLSHVRTHWMPTATMDQRVDLRALVLLIEQELDLIQNEVLL